jgi:hypothetical protein
MSDRPALFVRTLNGLSPQNDCGTELLRGVAAGTVLRVSVSRPRNLRHHMKYWALCSKVAAAIPGDMTAENVSDVLKLKTGHYTVVETHDEDGVVEINRIPRSISFAKMGQDEFSTFYDRCIVVICEQWLPHLKPSQLRDEIEQMAA